ncbi:hypothetical protein A3F08_01880 [Candidatus Berkelbacteria bacterium RIFCSPHIGHO2_12_FULL_36_9]|uniref:UDP-N-acetylmuramoyl-tripeptide--D-alanyl-D-alanine ligase n=1 Tax=Candidatus Berkelbacteria bacterium RIFCSPHIGHO2_12_FULL_36_9 TaxID=1797469 RepID=A0A1F5EEF2_9BACT|nr:MAG: hypothetical protein A3F08_01880 [Candidatus Berkelbacteria bacterium RIFCSPHIGHO2_12_FULL_36_9]
MNFAVRVLNQTHPDIIGVTGSVGKSSAKEAIFCVLKEKYKNKIIKSAGNFNSEIGTPLSILGFKLAPYLWQWPFILLIAFFRSYINEFNPLKNISILVLEFAADMPGDIYYLTSFIKPKIAVITYIGEAHLEFFESIDAIAMEKANLVRALPYDGWSVLNFDNEYCRKIGSAKKDKVIFYGLNKKADLWASNIEINKDGTNFILHSKIKEKEVHIKTIGKQQVYAVLAAICVGMKYNLEIDGIINSLTEYQSLPGRDLIIRGINDSYIIDSSYNANPTSMKAALETLRNIKTNGKKIAVLGGMKEIGKISSKAHKEIAETAQKIADQVILVGDDFKSEKADKWFINSGQATDFLLDRIEKDDIILIKGSHALEMNIIVVKLTDTNYKDTN